MLQLLSSCKAIELQYSNNRRAKPTAHSAPLCGKVEKVTKLRKRRVTWQGHWRSSNYAPIKLA